MKRLLICTMLFFISMVINAQVFPVETIKYSGANDKRINLVILSEGYKSTELDDFIIDATNFSDEMFNQSPFSEYANYFNVYAIRVPSNESGADHPGTATDVTEPFSPLRNVDTYFNATFDAFQIHRLLFYEIDINYANNTELKINSVLADNFPTYDQALILVNSNVYGGSGGEFPMSSRGGNANEIAIHELGHSLFDLKDEYYPGDVLAGEAINMTQETNASLVKWKNWIGTNGVGVYPYASSGNAANWNRPHQTCKMRYLGVPFCSVCKEGMIEKIHDLIAPIDSYSPVTNTIDNVSFPLDFALNLIQPIPNTLGRIWTLNGTNLVNDVDQVSILETDLIEGINTLSVVITDNTSILRIDNHETTHTYTVSWTINYSTLGLETISSEKKRYKIDMFPNPTNTYLNFKIETKNNTRLKVDLVSIDGKKVKSKKINTLSKINISNLKPGIYLANIYADGVVVSSRKIVKF